MSQSAAQRVDVSTLQASRWKFSLNSRYLPPLFITDSGGGPFRVWHSRVTRERRLRLFVLWSLRWCWAGSFGKWIDLASAYISGISVGILIRSPALWPYALCSVLSIMSKYVLRVKGRHLWNPSNFICVLLFLADTIAALTVQWGILSAVARHMDFRIRDHLACESHSHQRDVRAVVFPVRIRAQLDYRRSLVV